MSEPEPHVRRAVISWDDVRAWGKGADSPQLGPPKRSWRRIDLDGIFAFALFLPILFADRLDALSGAIFAGLLAVYAVVRGGTLLQILAPRLFLLIPAVLAVTSTLWSELPQESFREGLGLTLTLMAAILLSAAKSPGAVFRGVTGAFLTYLVTMRAIGASMQGGMGDVGATSALVALGMVAMAMRERAWPWAAAGAVAAAFELSALVQARPAGAILGLTTALIVVSVLALIRNAPLWVRRMISGLVAAGALATGVFGRLIAERMTAFGHGLVSSNPNLAQPSDVWGQARALIADQRWLGKGFYGLWPSHQQAGYAAHAAVATAAQNPAMAIHNSYIDILLQFGWVGLWIIGATLIIAVLGFARRFVWRPNLALCAWAGLLTYELVRIQVDVVGYAPFSPTAMLLTAALAATFSPDLAPRPPRPTRQPELPAASIIHLGEYRTRRAEKADPAFRHPDRPS